MCAADLSVSMAWWEAGGISRPHATFPPTQTPPHRQLRAAAPGLPAYRLLKPAEDEIAQHYAVKTVENICSQGGEWAAKFANQDVVFNCIQVGLTPPRSAVLASRTAPTLTPQTVLLTVPLPCRPQTVPLTVLGRCYRPAGCQGWDQTMKRHHTPILYYLATCLRLFILCFC